MLGTSTENLGREVGGTEVEPADQSGHPHAPLDGTSLSSRGPPSGPADPGDPGGGGGLDSPPEGQGRAEGRRGNDHGGACWEVGNGAAARSPLRRHHEPFAISSIIYHHTAFCGGDLKSVPVLVQTVHAPALTNPCSRTDKRPEVMRLNGFVYEPLTNTRSQA